MAFNRHGKPCGTGRSDTKFRYTYKDIADICHLKRETIRQYAWKDIFDPSNLASVVDWIGRYRGKNTPTALLQSSTGTKSNKNTSVTLK